MSPVTPPGPRMLDLGWTRLRVNVRPGSSDRRPLVLLNGIGAALEVLQPLVDALGPELTTIRIDVPGTGESPPLALPYSMVQMSWLVDTALQQLHRGPVDLLGYSWGGALAQQLAIGFPQHYRRLVLVSTSPGVLSVPGTPLGFATMMTPRRYDDPAEVAALSALLGGRGARQPGSAGPDRTAAGFDLGEPARWAGAGLGYLHQLGAVATWSSLPFLPLLPQPALVISGDDDPIVPAANAELIGRLIPRATVQLIPGGHTEIITAARAIGAAVTDFLASEPSVDGARA